MSPESLNTPDPALPKVNAPLITAVKIASLSINPSFIVSVAFAPRPKFPVMYEETLLFAIVVNVPFPVSVPAPVVIVPAFKDIFPTVSEFPFKLYVPPTIVTHPVEITLFAPEVRVAPFIYVVPVYAFEAAKVTLPDPESMTGPADAVLRVADIVELFVASTESSSAPKPIVVFAPAILFAEFIKIFPAKDADAIVIVWALPGFVISKPFNINELTLALLAAVFDVSFTLAFAVSDVEYSPEARGLNLLEITVTISLPVPESELSPKVPFNILIVVVPAPPPAPVNAGAAVNIRVETFAAAVDSKFVPRNNPVAPAVREKDANVIVVEPPDPGVTVTVL